jgi:hypothetical protein
MKVFMSWSGDRGKRIGELVAAWLPSVIQAAKPFFSPNDIEKGDAWLVALTEELAEADVAIIILTKENLERPWILFEAGSAYTKLNRRRACPVLFDLGPSDLKPPLSLLQTTLFEQSDMLKLCKTINGIAGDGAIHEQILEKAFSLMWPEFYNNVMECLKDSNSNNRKPRRQDREVLDEILAIVRQIAKDNAYKPENNWIKALKIANAGEDSHQFVELSALKSPPSGNYAGQLEKLVAELMKQHEQRDKSE